MLPGNFTRGAKKLNGGDGGSDKEAEDNDAEVTYFSTAAKDVVDEGDVIAARVAEEVRSVIPSSANKEDMPTACVQSWDKEWV